MAETANVQIGDIVRVVNRGEDAFTIAWDNRQYRLNPSEDVFVPFEAAALWFGDPRSSDTIQSVRNEQGLVAFVPDRDSEVRRLRVKYGNIGGDERFVHPAPEVEVFTLSNVRITTPLDDPEGREVNAATPTLADQDSLLEQVQRQQAQIDFLLQQLGLQQAAPEDRRAGEEEEVDEDGLPPADRT